MTFLIDLTGPAGTCDGLDELEYKPNDTENLLTPTIEGGANSLLKRNCPNNRKNRQCNFADTYIIS
jgi:hypothetical protein